MEDKSRLELVKPDEEDDLCPIPLKRRCELLGINRSSVYYKPVKKKSPLRKLSKKDMEDRMAVIDTIHTELPATGARKMARELSKKGMPTTRYEAARLMEIMNIYCIYPKPNLSKPAKGAQVFPYLLKNKRIWLPNQVWAIDITYIPFKGGHMYLTAIIDWYSRMIVGYCLSDSLENTPVLSCVEYAFARFGVPAIMNSDQGSNFTAKAYVQLLASKGVTQSMDGKARWVDNVRIERWFRTLKTEYLYINEFSSPRELGRGIAEFINKYNSMRLHESLDYRTPAEVWSQPFGMAA
jgi:putative transposase